MATLYQGFRYLVSTLPTIPQAGFTGPLVLDVDLERLHCGGGCLVYWLLTSLERSTPGRFQSPLATNVDTRDKRMSHTP